MDKAIREYGQQLADALKRFAQDIKSALAVEEFDESIVISKWKEAEKIIQNDYEILNRALSNKNINVRNAVLIISGRNVGLSKNLDTFSLDFAGKEWKDRLILGKNDIVSLSSEVLSRAKSGAW